MTENIQKGLSLFQLTAARRRLGRFSRGKDLSPQEFQLTAARRRLEIQMISPMISPMFQLTAARRRLVIRVMSVIPLMCFNSQPPEGGWLRRL